MHTKVIYIYIYIYNYINESVYFMQQVTYFILNGIQVTAHCFINNTYYDDTNLMLLIWLQLFTLSVLN
jgi:hypothetical protein